MKSLIDYEELEKKTCKKLVNMIRRQVENVDDTIIFSNFRAIEITHDYTFEETGGRDQTVCLAFDYAAVKYKVRYFKDDVIITYDILTNKELEFIFKYMKF